MTMIPLSPRNLLLPRLDTLGDLVLFTPFICALRAGYPGIRITLVVRPGYDQLASLLPADITWITLDLNGYLSPARYSSQAIDDELAKIVDSEWDLVCFTMYDRTWPEILIAAALPETNKMALGTPLTAHELALAKDYGGRFAATAVFFDKLVDVPKHAHETEKYRLLWEEGFSRFEPFPVPTLTVLDTVRVGVAEQIAQQGVGAEYFICMPAGLQNVNIKTWPVERFAAIIKWIVETYDWTPLVVGHESEGPVIREVASKASALGITVHTWFGKTGELDRLAALIAGARLYIGNDSAPLHIACAVRTPVVGLYGGGTFPRFMPVGDRAIGLAGELPCFGCLWVCVFGDAPCMRLVTVDDAIKAIKLVLADEPPGFNYLPVFDAGSERLSELIEKSIAFAREKRNEKDADAIVSGMSQVNSEGSLHELETRLDAMQNSLSWRITRPFRWLGDRLRRKK